jgi:hypothetical protein
LTVRRLRRDETSQNKHESKGAEECVHVVQFIGGLRLIKAF